MITTVRLEYPDTVKTIEVRESVDEVEHLMNETIGLNEMFILHLIGGGFIFINLKDANYINVTLEDASE